MFSPKSKENYPGAFYILPANADRRSRIIILMYLGFDGKGYNKFNVSCRHFSHVTKSRIFKNLNLREKADRNFCRTFLKNCFRHLKLYSNPPSWLARDCCHLGTFWKTNDWSWNFWEDQPGFRFWYVEYHRQRRLKSTKTGICS